MGSGPTNSNKTNEYIYLQEMSITSKRKGLLSVWGHESPLLIRVEEVIQETKCAGERS